MYGIFETLLLGNLQKRVHVIMAVNPQILSPDSQHLTLNGLPVQVQQMSVNDQAVSVFHNFVEQIARVSPGGATMAEELPMPTMQVRRSQRFMKLGEPLLSLPSTSKRPTSEKPTSEKPTARKVFGTSNPPQTLRVVQYWER